MRVRVLITSEAHFFLSSAQHPYVDGPGKYAMWANYLEAFDEVMVLARVAAEVKPCSEEARADGPAVSFFALPDYRGPWEYLRHLAELRRLARDAVEQCDAYILRVPGLVGGLVWRELRKRKKPYAVEVVADPWDAFGPGTWPSLFRPAFRRVGSRELKAMCREASAVHYVTRGALQRRYPAGQNAYSVGFSDALMEAAFASAPALDARFRRIEEITSSNGLPSNQREILRPEISGLRMTKPDPDRGLNPLSCVLEARQTLKPCRIGFIGSFSQMYKGPDVLLRAVAACCERGLDVEAELVGEGRCTTAMKSLAAKLGIADRVQFLGQIPAGKPVFAFLDSVDLFVMPSRAEGLPRALLEAMARGCPCIGSKVGGIPELLDASDMVPVGEPRALADKIAEVIASPARLKQMAARNLEKAKQFSPELLRDVRREFCCAVRVRAEEERS